MVTGQNLSNIIFRAFNTWPGDKTFGGLYDTVHVLNYDGSAVRTVGLFSDEVVTWILGYSSGWMENKRAGLSYQRFGLGIKFTPQEFVEAGSDKEIAQAVAAKLHKALEEWPAKATEIPQGGFLPEPAIV